jgi:hypothetical protein
MCTLLWFVCAMPVVAAMAWGMALLVDTAHGLSASTGVGTTAHGWLDVAARTNWMVGIFAQRPKKVYSTA